MCPIYILCQYMSNLLTEAQTSGLHFVIYYTLEKWHSGAFLT